MIDQTVQTTDAPGFKPFPKIFYLFTNMISCAKLKHYKSRQGYKTDGHGLKLEKNWAIFFHVFMICLQKSPKNVMVSAT